jgi:hypothetical protein
VWWVRVAPATASLVTLSTPPLAWNHTGNHTTTITIIIITIIIIIITIIIIIIVIINIIIIIITIIMFIITIITVITIL